MELYPHQRDAIEKLRSGSILCGGVGTGKSLTALAYFLLKECQGSLDGSIPYLTACPLYIITTARKRDTGEWKDECDRLPGLNGFDIFIDSWNNLHKYASVRGAFFIFDEQRVVGSGQWVKAFLTIAKRNRWILLSATPGDTWMDYIPVFVANGFYKNRSEFLRRHAVYNRYTKYPKVDRYLETGLLERYRRQITVVMRFHKTTRQDWKTIFCPYDAKLYAKVMARWDPWKQEPIQNISEVCYLLRRVSNSDISRLAEVRALWEKHPRMIIFYNFDYELELLRTLDGTVAEWNGHIHQPLPETKRWLYLVQYAAGAEGWNCTSTDTILFFSQNYSYKTFIQAAGRIDRLNTPYDTLHYYILRSQSQIDNTIALAVSKKQTFNERIFAKTFLPEAEV